MHGVCTCVHVCECVCIYTIWEEGERGWFGLFGTATTATTLQEKRVQKYCLMKPNSSNCFLNIVDCSERLMIWLLPICTGFGQQVYIIMLMHMQRLYWSTLILDKKLKVFSGFFLLVFPVYGSFCIISNPSSVLFISCGRNDRMIECEAWERDNACHNQLYLSCSLCALLFHECLLWVLQKINALCMPSLFS